MLAGTHVVQVSIDIVAVGFGVRVAAIPHGDGVLDEVGGRLGPQPYFVLLPDRVAGKQFLDLATVKVSTKCSSFPWMHRKAKLG